MMKKIALYIVLTLLFAACNSEDAWDVLKTRGSGTEELRELQPFTKIEVYNNINLVLQKRGANEALLQGWSNLLPKVKLTVSDDGVLVVEDKNSFNFVRDPSNMTTIYLSYSQDIVDIYFMGNGKIITGEEPLRVPSLTIISEDASGSIDLELYTGWLGIGTNHRNVADITLKGTCESFLGVTNWGNAPINLNGLPVPTASVTHRGTGDIQVTVSKELNVALYALGDLYYRGKPDIVKVERKAKGKAMQVD